MHQLTAREGLGALELLLIHRQFKQIISMVFDIAVSGNHETKSSAGRVIAPLTGLGSDKLRHDIDQNARREILPGTRLLLICVLLQEAFIQIAQTFLLGGVPVKLVDGLDDLLQILRLVDVALGSLIDFPDTASTTLAQMLQQFFVKFLQFNALFGKELVPTVLVRDSPFRAGFLAHLQKQDVGQFRDILMICNTVIPQYVAKIP